jgi:hypothetical protein
MAEDQNQNAASKSAQPEPDPASSHETPASLEALRRSRREAWRAGIFVVLTMLIVMSILLAGAFWLINR